ncbi:Uncharacterised protein [Candidatus Bilamarchaeum dharawalense]|uniref:Uncharacterized protein n=1 Tax=Candidatus Bilamarchaeum dharawalense TaxID=2885759 RepID=A0A5E4LPF3_9ARCH|nr:Uncharacterised protein [Candidatus Bilamarchaeum dharawalense]
MSERLVPSEERRGSVQQPVYTVARTQTEMIGNQVGHFFERESRMYTLGGVPSGDFQQTMEKIREEKNPAQRARMFLDFVYQLSEIYRVSPDKVNGFGIKYEKEASDPTKILETRQFNCLSGNFSFGCFVKTLAADADVEATVVMREVVSVSGSDYAGHVCGQITIKGAELIFDITNGDKKPLKFERQEKPNEYKTGGFRYVFGASYDINDTTLYAAQIQEKLVAGRELAPKEVAFLMKMDAVFLTYIIGSIELTSPQTMEKIAARIDEITNPNARLRLSLYMVEYYNEKGEVEKAKKYARIAAKALNQVIDQGKANELKLSPYLTNAAIAFTLIADEKKVETAILYKMMIVTLGLGNTYELSSARTDDARSSEEFFTTLAMTFQKRKAFVFRPETRDGMKMYLLENMAIAKALKLLEKNDFGKTDDGKLIKKQLTERLQENCREMGLSYTALANVTEQLLFNLSMQGGYRDSPETRYQVLLAKFGRIWDAVTGDTQALANLGNLYVGDKEGLADLTKWIDRVKKLS